jgi:hypothetical protein
MVPVSDPRQLVLLLLVAFSFTAVLAVIVLLFRSGRSVDFPELSTKFRASRHPPGRGHAPVR